MTGNRIAAILIGLAIMFALQWWGGFQSYSALALGALGYGVVRYIGYAIRVRRQMKSDMDQATEAVERGRKISN